MFNFALSVLFLLIFTMFNDMCFFIVPVRASCVNHNVTFTYNYIYIFKQQLQRRAC